MNAAVCRMAWRVDLGDRVPECQFAVVGILKSGMQAPSILLAGVGATALLDRLIHHSHVVVINGPSWRDHEHHREIAESRPKKRPKT